MNEITDETEGFTVIIKNISGGHCGTWCLYFKDALKEIKKNWNHGDFEAKIIKCLYKNRMNVQ